MLVEGILLLLGGIALFASVRIGLDFDPSKSTTYQYSLNKKSYLVATIIMFILLIKLPLFLFFVWTMDILSLSVAGAMCAAGIVSATDWGSTMFFLKIINLFLLVAWVLMHRLDLSEPTYPFTKRKFLLFQGLFFLLFLEFSLQLAHFLQIPTDSPVACCSLLFDQTSQTHEALWLQPPVILGTFLGGYILLWVFYWRKRPIVFGVSALAWMAISIHALIRIFSPYVYELPTHMCPFCLLQQEYYFVGYLVYILLFLGALGGTLVLSAALLKRPSQNLWYNLSIICNTLLFLLLCAYPLSYVWRNGVWL
ncbi:MAG: hypothetical protein J7D61_11020 [Marichromatium sp.]|nr:hypothetical protein [Marichromatium sp.]